MSFTRRRPVRSPARPRVEELESRLTPAHYTEAGATLNITLASPDESVTITSQGDSYTVAGSHAASSTVAGGRVTVSGNNATVTAAGRATYLLVRVFGSEPGAAVTFGDSGAAPYSETFLVSLDDPAAGRVTFEGASTFNGALGVSTTGSVLSAPGSALTGAGAGGVTLTATGGPVLLRGAVRVAGPASLATNADDLVADNPANDFTGNVLLATAGGDVSLRDANDLRLGDCSFRGAADLAAGGALTQATSTSVQAPGAAGGTLSFAGASVTLDQANNFGPRQVSLAVAGTGNATLRSTAALTLGGVTLGTGLLSVTARGSILQASDDTRLRTDGDVRFTVDTAAGASVSLPGDNRVGGTVTIAGSGGGVASVVRLHNAHPAAAFPVLPAGVSVLVLEFSGRGVELPALTLSGHLEVTAGGRITQSGNLTVGGGAFFTVLGDYGIDLTTHTNSVGGTVALNAPQSTQDVAYAETGLVALGESDVGRGALRVTAGDDIRQSDAVRQRPGAGPAEFVTLGGDLIDLSDGGNYFSGAVTFGGPALTTVLLSNASPHALVPALPASVNDLGLGADRAPLVLPSLSLSNLFVIAEGIFQQDGTALVVAGRASFDGRSGGIRLTGDNDFNELELDSSGPAAVTVRDVDDVLLAGAWGLGSGRLTVTAGGDIRQIADSLVGQESNAGPARFVSTGGDVELGSMFNGLLGPVEVQTPAGGDFVLRNDLPVVLGSCVVGGRLDVTSAGGITQAPGTALAVAGDADLGAAGEVVLVNPGNRFGGDIGLHVSGGNVRLKAADGARLSGEVVGDLDVTAGGSITQTAALRVTGHARLDAGAADIVLDNVANDFGVLSLSGAGSVVRVHDGNALSLGDVRLGATALNLHAVDGLSQVSDAVLTQAGPATISLNCVGGDLRVENEGNDLRGPVLAQAAGDVRLRSRGDLRLAAGSTAGGDLRLRAGGLMTLPAGLRAVLLLVQAQKVDLLGDVTTTAGGLNLQAEVIFSGARTLNVAGSLQLGSGVRAGGPLTLNLAAGRTVRLEGGTWDQGPHDLTVNGAGVTFLLDDATVTPSRLVLGGGTLSLPGGGDVVVEVGNVLQVGRVAGQAETVTLANGAGALLLRGTLEVGLGAVNDRLVKTGVGDVVLGDLDPAVLSGTGLAGEVATPVLVNPGGLVLGRFARSVDSIGVARPFRAGTDVVAAVYAPTQVAVVRGGRADADGVVSGVLPSGPYQVRSSLGGAAGLVVVETDGQLDVVVRNNSAASTLTIATPLTDSEWLVRGLAVNGGGAVSIDAPAANFTGDLLVGGALRSLTVRDLQNVRLLSGGGPASRTSLSARQVVGSEIRLGGVLDTLQVTDVEESLLEAERFGTLTVTGDRAAGIDGDLDGTLINRTRPAGLTPAIASVSVADSLIGTWDLTGAVGTVRAAEAVEWRLGDSGTAARHPGGVTDVGSLRLGPVEEVTVTAAGRIGTVRATRWEDSELEARSLGTMKVVGDFEGTVVLAGGGLALGSLAVGGDFEGRLDVGGDVGALSVGGLLEGEVTARGHVGTLSAGNISLLRAAADSLGTLAVTGNPATGLDPDVVNLDPTLHGRAAGTGLALGALTVAGQVVGSTVHVEAGGVGLVRVGDWLVGTHITLADPAAGALTSLRAGRILHLTLAARSVGTLRVAGTAEAHLEGSDITVALGVTTLDVKGDLDDTRIAAPGGIAALTVGRELDDCHITAGRIEALTAGGWFDSVLVAQGLGAARVVGYVLPETGEVFKGDLGDLILVVEGGAGIGLLEVGGRLDQVEVLARGGIGAVRLLGSAFDLSLTTDDPTDPSRGRLGSLTAVSLAGANVRATSIGTIRLVGAPSFADTLRGARISVRGSVDTPAGRVALSRLTVAGHAEELTLDVPGTVGRIAVTGALTFADLSAGYGPGARLGALSAGYMDEVRVATRQLPSLTVTGSAALGLAGDVRDCFFEVLGSVGGVGLGTAAIQGTVARSTFRVDDGDVASFAAAVFEDSDLLVGVRLDRPDDLSGGAAFTTNHTIRFFQTTRPFDPADPDGYSFRRSMVAAAKLGTITLAGVDPEADDVFGVAFALFDGAAGTVRTDGVLRTSGFADGAFAYGGL